jgi:hypothetical protein
MPLERIVGGMAGAALMQEANLLLRKRVRVRTNPNAVDKEPGNV